MEVNGEGVSIEGGKGGWFIFGRVSSSADADQKRWFNYKYEGVSEREKIVGNKWFADAGLLVETNPFKKDRIITHSVSHQFSQEEFCRKSSFKPLLTVLKRKDFMTV